MAKRVTLADVASEVGVSMMTVSRVINKKDDVSAQTEERVWEAVTRLGYRPNSIARGLVTQQTQTLGLVVPDVGNPFFSDIARSAEHQAYAAGYSVFLCNSEEDPQRELALLNSLEDRSVDGILLCSSRLPDADLVETSARFPAFVLLNRHIEGDDLLTVSVDDSNGITCSTEHLLEGGHRAIGLLAGPAASASGRQRLEGYCRALKDAGVSSDPRWIRHCLPQVEGAEIEAERLLREHPELTALICYNDLVAVGALKACAALGLSVPQDLAVVGFDDIMLAGLVTPSLTTCRVSRESLGEVGMRLLLAQIAGEHIEERNIMIAPELIVRESAPA
jgi:LacI family transcriptional regulator